MIINHKVFLPINIIFGKRIKTILEANVDDSFWNKNATTKFNILFPTKLIYYSFTKSTSKLVE